MGCVQAKEDEDALEQSASIGFHTWCTPPSSHLLLSIQLTPCISLQWQCSPHAFALSSGIGLVSAFSTFLSETALTFCEQITVHTAFFYTYPATSLNAGENAAWLPVACESSSPILLFRLIVCPRSLLTDPLNVPVSIVNASLNSCLAQLAEIFGRKRVILVGFTFAFIGAVLIATAQHYGVVIIGSVLLGGCLANEGVFFAIPSEVLPRRYRGFGQCLFSLTGGFACTAAVLVNGALL